MAGYGRGGFGGGFGGGSMQNLMKQAQKMQEEMQKAQEELEEAELEGASGGGIVKVILNGKKEMLGVSISPDAVDMDDLEMLEDLIMAAYNDAAEQADELSQEKLGKFGNIGGLM
ncbi:MAG: YbaB/EbfC family nucleoid-associated protein [Clostridia bacterium]|jgi:DNA-binding YbaB/EbfC family protein|nr:YbaB/EbfC family nucleoid-associated protein [Clostridia bacterium]MBQ1942256.1 YbaB/EbfC family nucleoid-associated protein [Clostridia bacterium]